MKLMKFYQSSHAAPINLNSALGQILLFLSNTTAYPHDAIVSLTRTGFTLCLTSRL